ncbi:hypothetical protein EVAR_84421_1 [Eumeta japonica]|uniref:Uncharacterized protein n=1 Tax=Eumeta variegata TaxID=151549 RepID=A0A4C1W259_EUMVA|nr:hypothetical protein EVAR_84421_1 [Eumeta japonica]
MFCGVSPGVCFDLYFKVERFVRIIGQDGRDAGDLELPKKFEMTAFGQEHPNFNPVVHGDGSGEEGSEAREFDASGPPKKMLSSRTTAARSRQEEIATPRE